MKKLKLLDLFAGVGGAGEGYSRAGYEVTAVDILPQPNNPHRFIQADAIEILNDKEFIKQFDIIHASPPCQAYSKACKMYQQKGAIYPDLIPVVRDLLIKSGKPYIIENVPSSPLRQPIKLCGQMFGLKVERWRWFELSDNLLMLHPQAPAKVGSVKAGDYITVCGNGSYISKKGNAQPKFKKNSVLETWSFAMNINWAKTRRELAQAIPPNYTEYIGTEIYKQVENIKTK